MLRRIEHCKYASYRAIQNLTSRYKFIDSENIFSSIFIRFGHKQPKRERPQIAIKKIRRNLLIWAKQLKDFSAKKDNCIGNRPYHLHITRQDLANITVDIETKLIMRKQKEIPKCEKGWKQVWKTGKWVRLIDKVKENCIRERSDAHRTSAWRNDRIGRKGSRRIRNPVAWRAAYSRLGLHWSKRQLLSS